MTTVLHVITDLEAGGAERMLVRMATGQHEAGRQIVVSLMDDGVYGAALRKAGIEVHCLDVPRGMRLLSVPFRLARIIRRHRPDVVMSWLYHADLMTTLAMIVSGLGPRRLIWNLRCSNMDLTQYAPTTRWTVSILARLSRLPGAIAANSHAGRLHHAVLGYRPRRWIELPNGFDIDEWRPDAADRMAVRSAWRLDEDAIAVGMIARVDPSKDHATFFEAARRVRAIRPNVRFVLAGRGTDRLPLAPELQDCVRLLGERSDVNRLVRGLDIAVLSSFTEGFPNVVGEAMASGVPCIVTDVGDSAQIVGDTGEVIAPGSPDALAGSILKLIDEPQDARSRRRAAARERIVERFGLDCALHQYQQAWLSVAGGINAGNGKELDYPPASSHPGTHRLP